LDPIDTKGLTNEDVDALVLSTRENMLKELKLVSATGVKAEKSQ